jgi:hypothetical protein
MLILIKILTYNFKITKGVYKEIHFEWICSQKTFDSDMKYMKVLTVIVIKFIIKTIRIKILWIRAN